jgi:hypothetical protein
VAARATFSMVFDHFSVVLDHFSVVLDQNSAEAQDADGRLLRLRCGGAGGAQGRRGAGRRAL